MPGSRATRRITPPGAEVAVSVPAGSPSALRTSALVLIDVKAGICMSLELVTGSACELAHAPSDAIAAMVDSASVLEIVKSDSWEMNTNDTHTHIYLGAPTHV